MGIGDTIRQRRCELGMSQNELAEKMGYNSRSTINKIELGVSDVSHTKLLQFSEILEISIEQLVGISSTSKTAPNNTLGEAIKTARKSKGMTQGELGLLLGVEKSAIAKYENGRIVNLKQHTLKKLSEILGISLTDIINNSEYLTQNSPSTKPKESFNRKAFTDNLRLLMAKSGKSRKDLSEALEVSYYTVTDWCNGKKYPRIEKLELLANYFGVSVAELVGKHGEEIESNISPRNVKNEVLDVIIRLHTDSEFLELVEKISKLDNEQIKAFQRFLKAFSE